MTAAEGWTGLGGSAMTMTAGMFSSVMGVAAGWLNEAVGAATNISSAYHAAETGMIPGSVSHTNRATQRAVVMNNWGQNTPAIYSPHPHHPHHLVQNTPRICTSPPAVT